MTHRIETAASGEVFGPTSTIEIDGEQILRFHPLHKKIKDGVPRCICCGQIDEPEFHKAEWCAGSGGDLPFPTSTLKMVLKTDTGARMESSQRITLHQWRLINLILAAEDGRITRPVVDQTGNTVGSEYTELKDLLAVEGHTDDAGTVWLPPTAFAYQTACAALNNARGSS